MRRSKFFRLGILVSSLILVSLAKPGSLLAEEKPVKSLYERLGGVYNIAPVVDEFLEVLYVDDILNANPKIKEARDRVPKAYLKYHVTSMVCQATGGPEKPGSRRGPTRRPRAGCWATSSTPTRPPCSGRGPSPGTSPSC